MNLNFIKELIELVLKGHDYEIEPYYFHTNKPNFNYLENNKIFICKVSEIDSKLYLYDNMILPLNHNMFYLFDAFKTNDNLTVQGYCIKTNDKTLVTKLLSEYFYKG